MQIRATVRRVWREHGARGVATLLRYYVVRAVTTVLGPGRECPVCGWRGREFVPAFRPEFGVIRARALCPRCGALERHRAYAPFYREFLVRTAAERRPDVLFFAPDQCLEEMVAGPAGTYRRCNYGSTDPRDVSLDLHDLALPDESVDVIVMNHVLCCVEKDRLAASNMHRVLRPGGVVVAGEHVHAGATTPDPPRPGYGGVWREYGTDVVERFRPFEVEILDATAQLPPADRRRFGIATREHVLLLRKRGLTEPSVASGADALRQGRSALA